MALPVSLEQAKDQLRITDDDQDAEVEGFIKDAAGWVEAYTGHVLERRTFTAQFSRFHRLELDRFPVIAGSVAVEIAQPEVPNVVVPFFAEATRRPARLTPAGYAWPLLPDGAIIQVAYEAGYTDPADVPRNFVRAMLILISAYDADREGGEIVEAAEAAAQRLCRRYRRASL